MSDHAHLELTTLSSTIIDTAEDSELATRSQWHPKFTGYRALVLALTAGFGLAKAISSYRGKAIVSISLEWVFGVVIGFV